MRVPSFSILSTALLLVGGSVAGCYGKPSTCLDASIVAHTGTPVGKEVKHGNLTLYISQPDKKNARAKARAGAAVLLLTDVFGLALPENRLLADSYARAGYLTVVPDLFNGSPAPGDINVPGFNTTEFLAQHGPSVTDPIIAATVSYLRSKLGVIRIAAPGYCFGGRYAFRFLDDDAPAGGVDVGFAAHPSLLEAGEIAAIRGPVSIAAADNDNLFDAAARAAAEKVLAEKPEKVPYQVNLYSGTSHGFGVRVNLTDPQQKYAKEQAFLQAARWFDHSFGLE
ncbi:alpha/beta-hydrolase [Parathielavia appendiculata]|uniref:Alpha/beta-hydrolase n=1 Tax=Parathielavia appendiculata TaxID=2587402 RepID=A0AAN6TYL8_9PEZI|nr:alpha/beta-hydrolase [Parathielavia appendiculata]